MEADGNVAIDDPPNLSISEMQILMVYITVPGYREQLKQIYLFACIEFSVFFNVIIIDYIILNVEQMKILRNKKK